MLKFINFFESILFMNLLKIKINYVDLIIHGICIVACYCHLKFVVFSISEGYTVILKVTLVGVSIFS